MKLQRFLTVAIAAVMSLGIFSMNVASAAGTYGISCKNDAYGMHLGSDYTDVAYVYVTGAGVVSTAPTEQYLIGGANSGHNAAYVGNDCIYAGAANTNGTAVVAGDVARMAVNAIVGAVSNRIDMAYAAKGASTSVTGLTFTTQSDGVSMAANKIIGGLSIWGDMANSNFENTQAFSSVRVDSMKYDGENSSYSMGVDKTFGNAMVGLVVSNLDSELKTTFNDGTYKQTVDTYGVYLAYRTSIIQIDLGMGTGNSDIDTTRRDLGNDAVITGKTTADIEYSNARIAANFTRGRFSIVPSASYRQMTMDIDGFTDVRPDDTSAVVGGVATIFSTANATLTTTDDAISARSVESSSTSLGVKLSASLGNIIPYIDLSWNNEDTTAAVYNAEAGTDGNDNELGRSTYSSSTHMGGGINFMIGSHISGGIRAGSYSNRSDWEEDYVAGNISLGF
jgi:hypothetical protein